MAQQEITASHQNGMAQTLMKTIVQRVLSLLHCKNEVENFNQPSVDVSAFASNAKAEDEQVMMFLKSISKQTNFSQLLSPSSHTTPLH